ncbi:hypothetical protein MMC21_004543 [Puttea exsequens]|nr:hypothetical protein [Puttea exsequens]
MPGRVPQLEDEIRSLIGRLGEDLEKKNLSASGRLDALNSLKSRITSIEAASVFTQNDIHILCLHAFSPSRESSTLIELSHLALKCLANVLLLAENKRQTFADSGYAVSAVESLESGCDDQLLCSRILFLLTYNTTFDFEDLLKNHDLAGKIHKNIVAHSPSSTSPAALTETLKLLFNLTRHYPQYLSAFTQTIKPILEILSNIQSRLKTLQPPVTQSINALLNLDLAETPELFFPLNKEETHSRHLISILDSVVRISKEDELENLVPLATLLRKVVGIAPINVKSDMQARLLPSNAERAQPLGTSDSLPSHLLRLTISPLAPNLRESISCLLFELSDQDATTFVRNVGYGYAAGFLMTHNLSVPDNALTSGGSAEDPGARVTSVDGQEINPVTGQRRDMEPENHMPEMTDEEKEREAERLFVLFERLKATGVMNVVNPVEQAQREGRFEEID